MESITWSNNPIIKPIEPPWQYSIKEEGHLFRFTCTYEYYNEKGERCEVKSDLGLIPGGAYAAIVDLVIAKRTKAPGGD